MPYQTVQHEVNNTLAVVCGHAELALRLLGQPRLRHRDRLLLRAELEAIDQAARGLERWVDRGGAGQPSGTKPQAMRPWAPGPQPRMPRRAPLGESAA